MTKVIGGLAAAVFVVMYFAVVLPWEACKLLYGWLRPKRRRALAIGPTTPVLNRNLGATEIECRDMKYGRVAFRLYPDFGVMDVAVTVKNEVDEKVRGKRFMFATDMNYDRQTDLQAIANDVEKLFGAGSALAPEVAAPVEKVVDEVVSKPPPKAERVPKRPPAPVQSSPDDEIPAYERVPSKKVLSTAKPVAEYTGTLTAIGMVAQDDRKKPGRTYNIFAISIADESAGGATVQMTGRDLERAAQDAGAKVGDRIRIALMGRIMVPKHTKDAAGNIVVEMVPKKLYSVTILK